VRKDGGCKCKIEMNKDMQVLMNEGKEERFPHHVIRI
jgi:hypothetical protein